ncbi:pre-mRNA-splicing factor syf2 [Coelomomyces lativittatus]|nr:pre-mRNA-splicing factor syf2 [Coelomomyces lativittatus]
MHSEEEEEETMADNNPVFVARLEKLQKLRKKMEIQEHGNQYERIQNIKYSIQDVDDWETSKSKKREREDTGFIDFNQASFKKYKRMIRQLQPDLSHYETQKQLAIMQNQTDAFYGKNSSSSSSSSVIVQPNKDDVDRLVKDLKHQLRLFISFF